MTSLSVVLLATSTLAATTAKTFMTHLSTEEGHLRDLPQQVSRHISVQNHLRLFPVVLGALDAFFLPP